MAVDDFQWFHLDSPFNNRSPPRFHNINIETIGGRVPFSTLFKSPSTFAQVSRDGLSFFQDFTIVPRDTINGKALPLYLSTYDSCFPLLFTVIPMNHGYMEWKCHGNKKKALNKHYVWINVPREKRLINIRIYRTIVQNN